MNHKVVLTDLDGTIALNRHRLHLIDRHNGRKPDWDAFFLACVDDLPNWPVIYSINALKQAGFFIHIFSARGQIAYSETVEWLAKHSIEYDKLTMRDVGCYTPDEELKQSWLMDFYPDFLESVLCVFDDRDKVVKMWRSLGLTCFQVAEGQF